jgi:hypothetical protein
MSVFGPKQTADMAINAVESPLAKIRHVRDIPRSRKSTTEGQWFKFGELARDYSQTPLQDEGVTD